MKKLILRYRMEPTEANRAKIAKYLQKHPMACVLVSPEDAQLLKDIGL